VAGLTKSPIICEIVKFAISKTNLDLYRFLGKAIYKLCITPKGEELLSTTDSTRCEGRIERIDIYNRKCEGYKSDLSLITDKTAFIKIKNAYEKFRLYKPLRSSRT
jgi:hypothetical protein